MSIKGLVGLQGCVCRLGCSEEACDTCSRARHPRGAGERHGLLGSLWSSQEVQERLVGRGDDRSPYHRLTLLPGTVPLRPAIDIGIGARSCSVRATNIIILLGELLRRGGQASRKGQQAQYGYNSLHSVSTPPEMYADELSSIRSWSASCDGSRFQTSRAQPSVEQQRA